MVTKPCRPCRSMAESYAPPDWKKALTGRQFERSGMQAYGAAKLFNIMLAKEYSKRLKACSTFIRVPYAWSQYVMFHHRDILLV